MSGRKPALLTLKLILTCEHAGNEIPISYKGVFRDAEKILQTHRGYDPGAMDLYLQLQELAASSFYHTTSRLLVEVNRSKNHPQLFSSFTKPLPEKQKKEILENYYFPYRKKVEEEISKLLAKKQAVLHLSVHSFTPELNGKKRKTDIGLLYDPSRPEEKQLCKNLKLKILQFSPDLTVRFNYPYLGRADGFTTYLRKRFPVNYMGIEMEVNQKFADLAGNSYTALVIKSTIFEALKKMLSSIK